MPNMKARRRHAGFACAVMCLACIVPKFAMAENWTRFRGPNGTGISNQTGIPTSWSPSEIAWTADLPGTGHSSPVIWNDKLVLTSANDDGTLRHLICLDANRGTTRWVRSVACNPSPIHLKNSFASSTPATDGERIYVSFANADQLHLAAYDFDGELLWRRNLGPFDSEHGHAASPIVFEDMVILTDDQNGPSSIAAFDRDTGQTRWSILRDMRRTSFATPMILSDTKERPLLICLSGAMGLTAHNPYTGEQIWTTGAMPLRTVASPVYTDGLLFATCGEGGSGKLLIAVDPQAAEHDGLSAGSSSSPRMALAGSSPAQAAELNAGPSRREYERTRTLPYVPTPVAYGKHVYLWNDNGVVCCMETESGKDVWTERVGGKFSGSPVCVDGKLYCIDESGQVVVIAASPVFKHFGTTPLDDPSHSTPAVANGRLYLRTFHRLVCLEAVP